MIEPPFHLIPFLLAQRPPETGRYVVPLSRLDAQTRAEMEAVLRRDLDRLDAAIKAHQETSEKHAALLAETGDQISVQVRAVRRLRQ